MDLKLKGKVALVTGSSRGIGLSIASSLAKEGCNVAMCARRKNALERAAEKVRSVGTKVVTIQADVLESDDSKRLVDETVHEFSSIDILINNVGGNIGKGLMETPDEEFEKTFHYNVFQGIRLTRLAVPYMRTSGGGSVIFIASISGCIPQLHNTIQYGASKAAQIFMAEPMALQLAHDNIRVNIVSPGAIFFEGGGWDNFRKTNPEKFASYETNGFPAGHLGTPDEVADVVVFLASERARWINGAHIRVDGLQQPVPANPIW